MREKLIELIRDGRYDAEAICNQNDDCQTCSIADPNGNCKYGCIADHLIANGVTIHRWNPASEPPKDCTEDQWVIYKCATGFRYTTGYFDGKCWRSSITDFTISVVGWMPLPPHPGEV